MHKWFSLSSIKVALKKGSLMWGPEDAVMLRTCSARDYPDHLTDVPGLHNCTQWCSRQGIIWCRGLSRGQLHARHMPYLSNPKISPLEKAMINSYRSEIFISSVDLKKVEHLQSPHSVLVQVSKWLCTAHWSGILRWGTGSDCGAHTVLTGTHFLIRVFVHLFTSGACWNSRELLSPFL